LSKENPPAQLGGYHFSDDVSLLTLLIVSGQTSFLELSEDTGWNAHALFDAINDDGHRMKVVLECMFRAVFSV
jgi:hypothetical protein